MKKLAVLTLLLILTWGRSYAQESVLYKKVSIVFDKVELYKAIGQLEEASGIPFALNNKLPEMTARVSGNYENTPLREILRSLLGNKNLGYEVIGDQIVIRKKKRIPLTKT